MVFIYQVSIYFSADHITHCLHAGVNLIEPQMFRFDAGGAAMKVRQPFPAETRQSSEISLLTDGRPLAFAKHLLCAVCGQHFCLQYSGCAIIASTQHILGPLQTWKLLNYILPTSLLSRCLRVSLNFIPWVRVRVRRRVVDQFQKLAQRPSPLIPRSTSSIFKHGNEKRQIHR